MSEQKKVENIVAILEGAMSCYSAITMREFIQSALVVARQFPAPIPGQVAQPTFAERLYGTSPDIEQRRDALHTMALIFAAAETDSAREATFEDMFKEFCAVPRMAIFDSLTRHTGAEIATNYTFETEEFFEVEAVERLLATQSAKQGAQASAWVSVDERLPAVGQIVAVYSPPTAHDWPGSVNLQFDCIDENDDDASSWAGHNSHYEHWCCVAKTEGATGPSEKAPYTHWMAIPEVPSMKSKRAASTDGEGAEYA